MKFISLPTRTWLHEAWNHKSSVAGGALAILSLSLGHYAGFLMKVPLQIVAVAGMPLAKGVTATFLFYVFFCAVCARVLTAILQSVFLPFIALADRLGPGFLRRMDWKHRRRFVRMHTRTIKWEGVLWVVFQMQLFLLLMLAIYIKFEVSWTAAAGLIISIVLVVLSGLVRCGFFLQPKPRTFLRKVRTRPARSAQAASAVFVTATSALIIVAFFLGNMRAVLLRDQKPHMVVTKEFTGIATVIASSDGALLLYQKQGAELRYIYSAPEFTASMETKSIFPPLGTKNGR